MKGKKVLVVFLAIVISVAAVFGVVSISRVNTGRLVSKEKYSVETTRYALLDAYKYIHENDNRGNVIVSNNVNSVRQYSVVNIDRSVVVVPNTSYELKVLDDGLFYYTQFVGGETYYTLISENGENAPQKSQGSIVNGVFTDLGANRYYVNVKGKFTVETDPLAIILPKKNAYKLKNGKYFDIINGHIFNKNGKFERSLSLADIEVPEDAELVGDYATGESGLMQYIIPVSQSESKFDILIDGEKYELVTLHYTIKNASVRKIKNPDYIMSEYNYICEDRGIVVSECQKIKDKRILEETIVQSFDSKGRVAVDLQKLMPGASSFDSVGEYVMLGNGSITSIYKGLKKVATVESGKINILSNGIAYYISGSTAYIYDLGKREVLTSINNVTNVSRTRAGNLKMTRTQNGTRELLVYNSESRTYSTYPLGYGDNYSSSAKFILCDNTLVFPDFVVANIPNVESCESVYTYQTDEKTVTVIRVVNTAGNNVYYGLIEKP